MTAITRSTATAVATTKSDPDLVQLNIRPCSAGYWRQGFVEKTFENLGRPLVPHRRYMHGFAIENKWRDQPLAELAPTKVHYNMDENSNVVRGFDLTMKLTADDLWPEALQQVLQHVGQLVAKLGATATAPDETTIDDFTAPHGAYMERAHRRLVKHCNLVEAARRPVRAEKDGSAWWIDGDIPWVQVRKDKRGLGMDWNYFACEPAGYYTGKMQGMLMVEQLTDMICRATPGKFQVRLNPMLMAACAELAVDPQGVHNKQSKANVALGFLSALQGILIFAGKYKKDFGGSYQSVIDELRPVAEKETAEYEEKRKRFVERMQGAREQRKSKAAAETRQKTA